MRRSYQLGIDYIATLKDDTIIRFTFIGGEPPQAKLEDGTLIPLSRIHNASKTIEPAD